ncbi:MAG: glutathione peroxidase [Archangium sp.]|nr:glutathione peroxidase [Archangium sp.]MDP3573384.1 glutathione peroxidase [Archangium sp.]
MKLHQIEVTTIAGVKTSLSAYEGKTILIVNTATGCGLAPQFEGLEALHRRFKDRGFEVLGFPCNQFGGQEPLSAEGIQETCRLKYDVTFPLFAKLDVNGPAAHPLYQHLKSTAPGLAGTEAIKWNFTKFLVNGRGEVVARFAPTEKPEALAETIEATIDGKATALTSSPPPVGIAATLARVVLGLALLFAGTAHLSFQRSEFLAQVPRWLPLDADFVVLASGVVELALGAALLVLARQRVLVGLVVAAFFVLIFPGNVSQYMNGIDAFGLDSDRARFIRLFFQPLLVAWALWSTGAWKAWRARRIHAATKAR